MKSIYLYLSFFVTCICHGQYSYVIGTHGTIYSIDIQAGCTATYVAQCEGRLLTDIAVNPSGKLYLCTDDSLFSLDINDPAGCIFLGRIGTNDITGLVVGPDGNVYASGNGLSKYDPVTNVFTYLGNFPDTVSSAGDLVFYNNRMYMSSQDGKIYEININNPGLSTPFYTLGDGTLWGMMIVPVKCFNDPVAKLRLLAFAPKDPSSSTAYMIDMENKISFPQYCSPNVPILGSADFNAAATVTGGEIVINNIAVSSPVCDEVADGSITITMAPSALNIYSFSLVGLPDANGNLFKDLAAGTYTIRIKNQFGCYIDSVVDIPFPNFTCKDSLFVPSAFTPDNNGLNDVFGPISFIPVADFEMLIYNRWGEVVFRSSSVSNKWDGLFRSVRQPTGVYAWQIRYKNFRGQRIFRKGIVTLIR